MKRVPLVVIFLVVSAGSRAFGQEAISACVKTGNGQIRIVAATTPCLPSETRVQWNVAGPAGAKGDRGPQGETGPAGAFRLVDNQDRVVGTVFAATTYYPAVLKVVLTADQYMVALDVAYTGFTATTAVYYTDTACTSADRYMLLNQVDFFRYGTVVTETNGQRFMVYPAGDPVPDGAYLRSYRRSGMSPGTCTTLSSPITDGPLANYRLVGQQLLDVEFPLKLVQRQ